MPAFSAKSADGRVEWIVSHGRLTEIGPYSPVFTLSAVDTHILKNLLCAHSAEIDTVAEKALLATGEDVGDELDGAEVVEGIEVGD